MTYMSKLFSKIDKIDLFAGALFLFSLTILPQLVYQPNRITSGSGQSVLDIFPTQTALLIMAVGLIIAILILIQLSHWLKSAISIASMVVLFCLVGIGGELVIPASNPFGRAAIGSGFWIACLSLWIAFANHILKLNLSAILNVALFASVSAIFATLLYLGWWDTLALLKEYKNETAFWDQGRRHIMLSLGSLIPAILLGLPLGIWANRSTLVKKIIFPILNILQTIPSLAMFGILMIPLSYIALNYPTLGEMGIRGIGAAPAVIALFFYSLLPIVLNTNIGIEKLDKNIIEAARGMGMSSRQRLLKVELPLAMPVILTGIRIVLVQNVGIVAVAGLIGGGGYGTYIFKGLNQTATELVMLGAIPTLYLALSAALLMDSFISYFQRKTS